MTDAVQDAERSGPSNIRSLLTVMLFVFTAIVLISIAGTADDSEAGSTFTVDGISYETTSDSEVKVTSDLYTGDVIIPSSVKNGGKTYSVTSIGDYAFDGCTSLKSVTIPNSITSIGDYTFYGCTSLISVTIPNSVTSIGDYTFNGCTSLVSVIIYLGVTSLGEGAFAGCTSLSSVTIPGSVTYLGGGVFYGCTSLSSVTIPGSVTSIGAFAFYECTSLKSVTIPNSVTSIGDNTFYGCISLSSVTIPNSVTSIGDLVFYGCTSLSSVTIPNSVTSIGDLIFAGCTSLSSVTISNSVTSLGQGVFAGCTSLSSVTIPNSVTSLGDGAFAGCTSLSSVTIPNGVTSIGDNTFYGCTSLTSITVENTIPFSIGSSVFPQTSTIFVSKGSLEQYRTQWSEYSSQITAVLIASFESNGGTSIDPQNVLYGGTIVRPTNPMKTGYTFEDWYINAGLTDVFTFDTLIYDDTTLYAKWSINQYTITFDSDGGSSVNPITQDYGTAVTAPENPTKTGHTFIKWTLDGKDYTFTTMPAQDITLKAVWQINQYTITFDTDGGSSVDPITQDYGSEVSAPENPTKTGYTFIKWQLNGEDYTFSTMPAENITLKAVWSINQYTMTFDSDGGSSVDPISQDYGTAVSAPENPTKTGYTFIKWQLNGEDYTFSTMPAENITLKAVWQINQYTISFDTDGGSSIDPITQDYGTAVSAPEDPTKTGYTFVKWTLDGEDYTFSTIPAQDITLKAVWQINQYTITFDSDGGSSVSSITQDYGSAVSAPENPVKIGHTFVKWTLDGEDYTFSTMPAQDITLKAVWQINQYTITFDTDGGSSIDPITQDYGTAVKAPADPVRTGYSFIKWQLNGEDYTFSTMPAENITLKAVWQINQYTISFDTDGGSSIDPITQDYGTAVSAPGNPAKTEHTFVKWTLNDEDYTFSTMPAQDITLKAVWLINRYTAVFMNEGEVFSLIEYDYNSVIKQPDGTPTKKPTSTCSYEFASWYGFTAGMVITENIAFNAVYTGTVKKVDTSGNKVVIDTKDVGDVKVSSDIIEQIRTAGNSGKGTEISLSKGKISLDGASAAGLPSGAAEISLNDADISKIPSEIKGKIGDRPVYSISFGDVHEFGGVLTISVEYELKDGEKAEDVCIWYLKNDGTYERISATYADGYVTFTTNHLSEYAVMVDPQPAPSDNGSSNTGLIIGGIVVAIAAIAVAAFIVMRKH